MDKRCLLQLDEYPECWCPLAVLRLKAIRHLDKELSEEEENKLPGCRWAVNSQVANYCFFDFANRFLPNSSEDKGYSEIEVAHLCGISIETVRKSEKRALQKVRNYPAFQEIIKNYKGERIMDDRDTDVEFELEGV